MAKKQETEDKTVIKAFKDGSSNWFVNYAHYHLNKNNELEWCSGEVDKPELRDSLLAFIRRNKKIHKERSPSIFESAPKEYNEIIPIGKFKGQTVQVVYDIEKKYLTWMYKEYNFAGKEKLKQEIKEILGK